MLASPFQKCLAEFIGTFALNFGGVLAVVHFAGMPGELIGVALAHGVIIITMVAATIAVCGAHFNPAVTLGLLLVGRIKPGLAAAYIAVQVASGFVAAGLLLPYLGEDAAAGLARGTPYTEPDRLGLIPALALEALLTFFLVFVIYGSAVDRRGTRLAPLYIGLAVTMGILIGGPLTGAAMNPARYTGVAVVSGDAARLGQAWLYWVGPLLGGVAACLLWKHVLESPDTEGEPSA